MKLQTRTGLALWGVLIVCGCGGGDDSDGSKLVAPPASLTTFTAIQAGPICEAGGTMIQTGSDDDNDGQLSSTEVTGSVNVCSGAEGSATNGTNGDSGAPGDMGAPGVDGTPGDDGTPGVDGTPGDDGAPGESAPTILSSSSAADTSVCAGGGTVVSFGGDDDDNGTLDAEEIDSTTTVCSGVGGGDSCAPVMKITALAGPTPCAAGGVMVEYGADGGENGQGGAGGAGGMSGSAEACDGMLHPSEITATEIVCNGEDGEDGDPGNDGSNGDPGDHGNDGSAGTDGTSMAIRLVNLASGHATCANGGLLLESGIDDNENGVLENGEVDNQNFSCF